MEYQVEVFARKGRERVTYQRHLLDLMVYGA